MALTRAFLKGMNLTEEQVSAIIEEHTSVTSALKDEIKTHKATITSLEKAKTDLEELQESVKKDDWKNKYEKEHAAFDDYKKDVSAKELLAKKRSAYKSLLKGENVGESHIDSILKVTDFSTIELDENDALKDADKLKTAIKKEWSGFIQTVRKDAHDPQTPPQNDGDGTGGRASKLAAKYHANIYGTAKEN